MNFPWAIRIAREDAASLGELRLADGLEVAGDGDSIWLRGKSGDERLAVRLSALPACERHEWLPSGQLRRIDQRIPVRQLPVLEWHPLGTWLRVQAPAAAIPANAPKPISLRLVRTTREREPELLLAALDELECFARDAAQVRLACLHFAANADGFAMVRGRPLPPVPGHRFVLSGNVAVPAGYSWEPEVGIDVLARCFRVSGDALAIWNEGGSITRLEGEQFIPLTRRAIRASREALVQSE